MISKKLLVFLIGLVGIASPTFAHPSWGIVVDKNQNIYFADILHNQRGSLWKLDKSGKLHLLFKDFHAHNVSLDKEGNLVTAFGEMDEHFMIRLLPHGKIDTLVIANNYEDFNGGNCTYSPRGEILFQAKNYFWKINSSGQKKRISNHRFAWNQSIFTDDAGNYYGSEIGEGRGKIIMINPNGDARILAENLISKTDRAYDKHADVILGITKDEGGNIYAAETAGRRIVQIKPNGDIVTFYTSKNDWFPTGIFIKGATAYILEYKEKGGHEGPQIVKFIPGKETTVLFNYEAYQKGETLPASPAPQDDKTQFYNLLLGLAVLTFLFGAFKFGKTIRWKP